MLALVLATAAPAPNISFHSWFIAGSCISMSVLAFMDCSRLFTLAWPLGSQRVSESDVKPAILREFRYSTLKRWNLSRKTLIQPSLVMKFSFMLEAQGEAELIVCSWSNLLAVPRLVLEDIMLSTLL